MSLINDMLRDLEGRSRGESSEPVGQTATIAPPERKKRRGPLLLCLVLVPLLLVSWLGAEKFLAEGPDDKNVNEKIEVLTEAVEKTATIPQDSAPPLPVEVPAPLVSESIVPSATQPVDTVLPSLSSLAVEAQGGGVSLRLNFERMPEYRIDQNDRGLASLVISFRQTQLEDGFSVPDLSDSLIERISFLPRGNDLQMLIDVDSPIQVQGVEVVDGAPEGSQLVVNLIAEPVEDPVRTARPLVEDTVPAVVETRPQVVSNSVVPAQEKEVSSVSKKQKQVAADIVAFNAGVDQLGAGQLELAEARFVEALRINPNLSTARLQLLALLLQRNAFLEAETLLLEGLAVEPESAPLRKNLARLFLGEGRVESALEVLQHPAAPSLTSDLEYHALLAALLQENKQFEEAATQYKGLLQVRPDQSLWWLGLGVSQDQMQQFDQARDAYEKAAVLPGLSPSLQNYIHGRLEVL